MSIASGQTPPGNTKWIQYSKNGIYVDVDTSWAGFTEIPVYVSSISGRTRHWVARGASSIYQSTPNGFRVYINYPNITPGKANSWHWHMHWMAMAPFTSVTESGDGSSRSEGEQAAKQAEQEAKKATEEAQKSRGG